MSTGSSSKRAQGAAPGDEDSVRISCSECPEFDLCTTCFSRGIELGAHRNDHPYRVVTRHRFPIFTETWSADEELLLIDGLRQFGMGNWKDAAEHVGTKTKEECEQHYNEVYVGSASWPLPDMDRRFDVKFARPHGDRKNGSAASSKCKTLSSQPSNHEIVGYMPGRLEFETEYENEAEQVVKDMMIADDDSPEEVELKQIVLRIYNGKLDRRQQRKRFIFERGLLEYRKHQSIEKKRTKEERELVGRVKVFARMQTKEDYDALTAGLLSEHALRQRIAQLQEWRRNGITSLDDGAQFEAERSQRLSRRATTLRDSAHLLDRLQKIVLARSVREVEPSKTLVRKSVNPLDIENAEGVELLSPSERDICSRLRIFPRPYLVVKEALLAEYARTGILKRRQARQLVKIDVNKTSKLYDFFVQSGWIKAPNRAAVLAARDRMVSQEPS
ncbi:Transcriptional adapter ada2 [Coemansia sp. RSA 2320]|nr:Transcriptional adapter ada2 [Coemansia sp. RSA 2320]